MPRDGKIMAAAQRRFQADKERRREELERRRQEAFRRSPAVEEVDRELRGTAARIVAAAFDGGGDPEEALKELERRNLELQREQAERLVAAGFPYDYLDDAPSCRTCGDSGWLEDGRPCRCLMSFYAREQNRRLSKLLDLGNQSFETFSLEWYSDRVWEEYGWSPLENMRAVREICGAYARGFSRRSGNLFSVVYDTAGHVFQQFESGKFGRENPFEEDPDREVNRYLNCDLLIMDDVGTEMLTSFVQSAFYRIVNDRLVNGRKTVLSTNLPAEEIGRRYGEAVLSRIQGEYQILRFFGEDIRILKRDR